MTKTTISLVPTLLLTSAFGIGVLAGACKSTEANPDHCSLNEGDRYCAEISPDRPVCSNGYSGMCNTDTNTGCVAAEDLAPGCADPCGTLSSEECEGVADDSSSGGSGTATGGDTETTTDPTAGTTDTGDTDTTTGPVPCMGNEECTDAAAPVCGTDGICVPCDQGPVPADGDGACAAVDPTTPVCLEGTCVTCTAAKPEACTDQLLLCDEASNECMPCREHDECEVGACEIAEGRCFPADATVVEVDQDPGAGLETSITDALMTIGAGGTGIIVLHQIDAMTEYPPVSIVGGKIAILSAPGEDPVIRGTGINAGLTISGATTVVYLDGIDLTGASDSTNGWGLNVAGALAWVDRGRIVQNNAGGVIASSGAELTLRNCFVGGEAEAVGLTVNNSTANVIYTTIGSSTFGSTPAMTCSSPQTVTVRNSIVLTQGGTPPDELTCAGVDLTNSATDTSLGAFDTSWFVNFLDGDYHLTGTGDPVFDTVASWQQGDPATDIDGEPRPTVDGTPDYAGADVLP